MKKIQCLNVISKVGLGYLTTDYALTDSMDDADGILVRSASLHDAEFPPQLLAIARAGVGVNNIPIDECSEKGIVVFNTPGANANAVKELVICGMLLAARNIVGGINWCRDNQTDPDIEKSVEKAKNSFAGNEIAGKKLGVIGLGAIGTEVANAASALGMQVYGYDPYISVNAAWNLSRDVKHITSADEIYENCDYITIHVPLTDSNRGMLNASTFARMKDGVVILNFARGALVNDEDMAEALKSGKVGLYVTDFPTATNARLPHTILIPHLGASTEESEDNCARMAVMELMDYFENGNIHNSVNFPECDMGICHTAARVAVLHHNIPNMIGQITAVLAAAGLNIANMTNKSKGSYAYTVIDLESSPDASSIQKIRGIGSVLRVRVI